MFNTLTRPKRILVLQYNGFELIAYIAEDRRNKIHIAKLDSNPTQNIHTSLEQILRLSQNQHKLPKQAIVLTTQATPALLELPMGKSRMQPSRQFHDLVRWEVEPILAEQYTSRPIGSILMGKSYLTMDQSQRIVDLMQQEQDSQMATGQPVLRFGEYAIKEQLITDQQLDECLDIQEKFQSVHDDLVCGWSYQRESESSADENKHVWLASAISRETRNDWVEMLDKVNIQLLSIYPLISSSAALLNGEYDNTNSAIMEFHKGALSCVELHRGSIRAIHTLAQSEQKPNESLIRDMLDANTDHMFYCGENTVQFDFDDVQMLPMDNISLQDENLKKESIGCVAGAAAQTFGKFKLNRLAAISAEDIKPELKSRPSFWIVAVLLITFGVVVLMEAVFFLRWNRFNNRHTEISKRLAPMEAANESILSQVGQNKELSKKLDDTKDDLVEAQEKLIFLHYLLNKRRYFSSNILKSVAMSTPQSVVLREIIEQDQGIQVNGWTMREEDVQRFAVNLTGVVSSYDMTVDDVIVTSESDGTGVRGYLFAMNLVKKIEERNDKK